MDTAKVVMHEIQRQRMNVIFQLFAETVCQASEAAHRHAHGEVLALNVACGDVGNVRIALNTTLLRTDALSGAVAALWKFLAPFSRTVGESCRKTA